MASSGVKISRIGPFEYNPRGNIWFKNENAYGRQLLSKMGWRQGKGLGKNEDGIKENIQILKKDNNAGVGYKNDTNIAVGCLEYENILNKLQQRFKKDETKWNIDSLEQRSQNSTNHLHYHKFVRGKDLYRYSEKDMKCIFLDNPQETISSVPEKTEDTTFNSQLNMKEYFAMKMKQKIGNLSKLNSGEKSNNPVDQQQYCPPDPVSSKKRKRPKKSEKIKRIKLECEETLDEVSNAPNETDTSKEKSRKYSTSVKTYSVKKINMLCKKVKSKKKKLGKIKNLKSCLKNKFTYHLGKTKNVSFNDVVDIKIFDSDREESKTEINDTEAEIQATYESDVHECENEACTPHEINASDDIQDDFEISDTFADSKIEMEINDNPSDTLNEHIFQNTLPHEEQIISIPEKNDGTSTSEDRLPQCLDLPKNSGSNFNSWLESQRSAMKMKLYKSMIKKIQKDPVLSTSNILDIKGYGNWGY